MTWLSDAWDSFTNFLGTGLENEGGNARANRPADVARVQRVMAATGYYPNDRPSSGILDRSLRDGLQRFQGDHGLRPDGWMRPDGPTHQRLRSELETNLRSGHLVRRLSDGTKVQRPENQAGGSFSVRLNGLLQLLGGGFETVAGAAGAAFPEPLTTAAGLVPMGHGADNIATGARKLWTGRSLPTATSRALQSAARALGADEDAASRMVDSAEDALMLASPAGVASSAGYGVRFLRYPSVGGFGINLEREGKRFFTADIHRFKHHGVGRVRPHYHRYPNVGEHRPWERGW